MKLGLHAFSLQLAAGLRDYLPVGAGVLSVAEMLERAAKMELEAVQLARSQVPFGDMMAQAAIGNKARALGLELHLSTNLLAGDHLVELIHAAHNIGAKQITVGLSRLHGSVEERQRCLESLLMDLDTAIKRAERYEILLAVENGRHTAAADLRAFIEAAQSECVGVCFDMGNALTVPESPVEAARILAPYCRSAHLKDMQVYRTAVGATLVNCSLGDGVVELNDVLQVLKTAAPELPLFIQTGADRVDVPLLQDEFLTQYPRITARAMAGLLRRGTLTYDANALKFPHERKEAERDVLKWEETRLKFSLQHAQKLMGTESLTLALGLAPVEPEEVAPKVRRRGSKRTS